MEIKSINYITIGQFGTFNHIYQTAKILISRNYRFSFFGVNENLSERKLKGVEVLEVRSNHSLKQKRNAFRNRYHLLRLIWSKRGMLNKSSSINIVTYFTGCSFLLLFLRNTVLDVRTMSVSRSRWYRAISDLVLNFEAFFFPSVSVLSEGMKLKFIYRNNISVIPLGGPKFDYQEKSSDKMSVLYVGTLKGRSVLATVKAFHKFVIQNPERPASYDIVARGDSHQKLKILKYINQHALHDYVSFHGEVNFPELTAYYLRANVGLSYIPITPYYDNQPPTKTFEYLLAGMYVIATATSENRRVINSGNGCLIGDGVEDMAKAFLSTAITMPSINNFEIHKDSEGYSWDAIVENDLLPLLNRFKKK